MSTFESTDATLSLPNRHFMYTLLGRLLGDDPTPELMDLLHDEHVAQELAFAASFDPQVGEAAEAFLAAIPSAASDACDALAVAYTRLFVGPAALPAPPWESVYVNAEPLLFQKSTLDVRSAYREAGYLPAAYPHVADDHLAIELNFMAALAGAIVATSDEASKSVASDSEALLRAQAVFLDEHLLRWVDAYAQRLGEHETSGLYLAAARLVTAFCAADRNAIDRLLAA